MPINGPENITYPFYTIDKDTFLQYFREQWAEMVETANPTLNIYRDKMKKDFDKNPSIRLNSFVIGEKFMLKVSKELKVKLGENIYGPYIIAEIYKTSAKICVIV